MMRRRLLMRSCLAIGALFLVGCERAEVPHDLLLVTLDTTRHDVFSFAGHPEVETPVLDALASEGTVFEQAIAPAPLTLVSHATLFTGQIPPVHGVRNNGGFRLSPDATTLAEVLVSEGFRTGAFVGAAVLDKDTGLAQGFEHYDDAVDQDSGSSSRQYMERRAEDVVASARTWLGRQNNSRTFLWVHLFDPHAQYQPPEPERSRYRREPYLGEVAYCDRIVGELLDEYERLGRRERLLVAVTADHGESLGEHGESTHGVFVYDETLRIPLLLGGLGAPKGKRVKAQVGLVDLLPTLLELLGLPRPSGIQGTSLRSYLTGSRSEARAVYFESQYPEMSYGWNAYRGVRMDGWKLIEGADTELFNLEADPKERDNVADTEADRLRSLRQVLAAQPSGEPDEFSLDPARRRQLEALGYVSPSRTPVGPRPSSRERISLLLPHSIAQELFDLGFHRTASFLCQEVQSKDVSNPYFQTTCEEMERVRGRTALVPKLDALDLERVMSQTRGAKTLRARLEPMSPVRDSDPRTWLLLFRACRELNDPVCSALGAVRAARLVADHDSLRRLSGARLPEVDRVEFHRLVDFLSRLPLPLGTVPGRPAPGASLYDTSLERAKRQSDAGNLSGLRKTLAHVLEIFFSEEDLFAARSHEVTPRDVEMATLLDGIAEASWSRGDSRSALQAWTLAFFHVPESAILRFNLGLAWKALPDRERAARHFEACLRLDPDFPGARDYLEEMRAP